MDCPWEDLTAFLTLHVAQNSDEKGAFLSDVVAVLGTDNIGAILRATGFEVDEVNRTINLYVLAVKNAAPITCLYLAGNPSVDATNHIPNLVTTFSNVSRNVMRDTLLQDFKLLTKKLVCDIFPREDQGVFLCLKEKDPALRRPAWLMDDLFRKLSDENIS
jgi:hypothetical protein